jgi:hypothetical protein
MERFLRARDAVKSASAKAKRTANTSDEVSETRDLGDAG